MGNLNFEQNQVIKGVLLDDSKGAHAQTEALVFGTKRDVAAMLKMSVRSVDNFISEGCPVIKVSPRCCRFDLVDVREWFKTQYGQQRRKRFSMS